MAKNTKFKNKLVLVEWLDAESIDEWTSEELVDHSTAKILSAGWMIKEGKDSISLALNHDTKNGSYSCIMKIPAGMVQKIKLLKS